MTWRSYLRLKTRSPDFLWRLSLAILGAGVLIGLAVDWVTPAAIDSSAVDPFLTRSTDIWRYLEERAEQSQWQDVWWGIPSLIVAQAIHVPRFTALALLTGMAWLAFSLQATQVDSWRDPRWVAPCLALILGVASIWPTAFFILWQEHGWGLAESDGLAAGLRYNILGIGLREEAAKLLCFAPLLPWLVWRRDELSALICAGCVGVGFGMEENIGYIGSTLASATLGRLLTATPFHMALTGLVGVAAYRACRWPRQALALFLATFAAVVLAHGFYDAFLQLPALAEYAFASFVIFLLCVYQYFGELRPLQTRRNDCISLTANFLACVCLVAAANFIFLCATIGWQSAAAALAQGVAAQGIMVYLFLREMPERLVDA